MLCLVKCDEGRFSRGVWKSRNPEPEAEPETETEPEPEPEPEPKK